MQKKHNHLLEQPIHWNHE